MTDKKDPGKTVIRPMPGGGFGQGDAKSPPAGGAQKTVIGGMPPAGAPPAAGGQKTVIGGVPPASGFGGGFGGPPPGQGSGGGFGGPSADDVWGGGGGGTGANPPGDPNAWMGAKPKDEGFFPDVRKPEPHIHRQPTRKISLDKALSAKTSGHSSEANPITAAAASLLILFGRLRSGVVDMHALPLMQHVTEEIEGFERRVLEAGVDPQDAMVAKYCLCGTADDIVQNLPGTDKATWLQYSMVARFFNKRTSGVGFFQEVDKALQNPAHKYNLLELMLVCLQLGFEGQYRGQPGGDVQLQNVKRGIYEALRRVKPRGDDDISPRWKPVEMMRKSKFGGVPVWVIAIIAAALLTAAYFAMRLMLVDEGNALATRMTSLHPPEMITINRDTAVEAYVPPPPPVEENGQFERITEALAGDPVEVSRTGDFIVLDVNNAVLFDSGKAEVKAEFAPLAEKIAAALDGEPGPVRIVGHTDNVPMSGTGRYKNNFELSVARANGVAGMMTPLFTDAARVEVDGRGEDEPRSDNATPEGRAANRRVEIMIQREDTL
ncbi:type VI secretion system protein TssL, long form [Tropicimonas sp. IMCC34011]|uniref:type VI secretion system protein TssL, long form n=1 Tax=Tropicimonas sp. IMCC34011 TaxID=2248759 RepID=UPI000E287C37|nr:type VI secretion system protein TssL, long form [Tropicimonas sp. IMCC34011]